MPLGNNAGNTAQEAYTIAIGYNAAFTNQGEGSIAIGADSAGGIAGGAGGQGPGSIAIGYQAAYTAQNNYAIAIGNQAAYSGGSISTIAIGNNAAAGLAAQAYSIALGSFAGKNNLGESAIAIGNHAAAGTAAKNESIAIGTFAGYNNLGENAIAIGSRASYQNGGTNTIAIGRNTQVPVNNGIVIGNNSAIIIGSNPSILIGNGIVDNPFTGSAGLYINPIRQDTPITNLNNVLVYDDGTNEVTYGSYTVPDNCPSFMESAHVGDLAVQFNWIDCNGNINIDSGGFPFKTFVIDHPKKPDNYLVHACLEGPEAGVYYRGTAHIRDTQDSSCYVEIELPDYVDALATNFTVHVTPIFEGTMRSANATRVKDNKFRIYGDPGEVDWVVYGKRGSVEVEPLKQATKVNGDGPYKWI